MKGIKVLNTDSVSLKKQSVAIKSFNKELRELAQSMIKYGCIVDNCVGLAAPQVGKNVKMCVALVDNQWDIIVNPKIIFSSNTKSVEYEGCMSLKEGNLFGKVIRPDMVLVEYFNEFGKRRTIKFKGFYSHLIQHEIDHMLGIIFTDRMKNPKKLYTDKELEVMFEKAEKDNVSKK